MSALGTFQKLFDLIGGVRAKKNPVTGRIEIPLLPVAGFFPEQQGGEVIAVVGDSITEGAMQTVAFTQSATGYQNNHQFLTPGPNSTLWTNINTVGNLLTFIEKVCPTLSCSNSDTYIIAFDGVSKISVNMAGEGFGAPVDVSSGGWFTALSAGGSKGLHFTCRYDYKPLVACSDSGTLNSSMKVLSLGRTAGSWASLALLALGGATNREIYHFGISSDTLNVIKRRAVQITNGLKPGVVLIMASINSFPTLDIADLVALIKSFNDIGSYVIVSTLLPIGTMNSNSAKQLAAINTRILRLPITNPLLRCRVFDAFSLVANPLVAGGATILAANEFSSDLIHPTWAAIMRLTPALKSMLEPIFPQRRPSLSSVTNNWDATYNPSGNLMASPGKFIGAAGTKGTNPISSGSVPTGWEDLDAGASAWASVVYKSADDASPVARTDGVPGNWCRVVCTTAGASGSTRQLRYTVPNNFVAGRKYRLKGTMRVSNASYLTAMSVTLNLYSTSGRMTQCYALHDIGYAASGINSAISDTGALYLVSYDVDVPADFTGLAYVNIYATCGVGGSVTLDLADFIVEPA